jgi:hypothetical protein
MDITYLLVICAALSVVVLAALDAVSARRTTDQTPTTGRVTHRALGE